MDNKPPNWIMPAQQVFRLRKAILYQGVLYAVFFSLATGFYSSLLVLKNPANLGFRNAQAAAIIGGAGGALFGSMLILSLCMICAYFIECFQNQGSTVFVRSLLQNRQFDRSEIQHIRWKPTRSGGIRFRVFGSTVRLDLDGFARQDRLQIVRIIRNLVPGENQEGWDMFCHKVALPLRDDPPSMLRVDESVESVLITRKRYDRLVFLLLPASIIVATILWWWLALPQFFVLPPLVAASWLLLRFNVPKEGRRLPELTSIPAGRAQLAGWSTIVFTHLLFIGMALAGVAKNVACTITAICLLCGMIPFVVWQLKADRRQREADRRGAAAADTQWRRAADENSVAP